MIRGYVDSSAEALDVVPRKVPGLDKFFFLFLITKIAQECQRVTYSNFRIHKARQIYLNLICP